MRYSFLLLLLLCHVTVSAQEPADTDRVLQYGELSDRHRHTRPDSAAFYLRDGLRLSQDIRYRRGTGMLLYRMGRLDEQHGHLMTARMHLEAALSIFRILNNRRQIAATCNSLGIVAGRLKQRQEANKYFNRAMQLFREDRDTAGLTETYMALGSLYEQQGDTGLALRYYLTAADLDAKLPDTEHSFLIWQHLGMLYSLRGDTQTALAWFDKGVRRSDSNGFGAIHAGLLAGTGSVYEQAGDRDRALIYYKQAVAKAREHQAPEAEARGLVHIASVLKEQKPPESLEHLGNALRIARNTGNRQLAADICLAIAEVHRLQANYREALTALDEHQKLLDSLLRSRQAQKAASLQTAYELEESRVHIDRLHTENRLRTQERNIAIFGVTTFLILLFFSWRYLHSVRKLNRKLREINEVKDKMFSVIGHDLRGPVGSMLQLLEMMEQGTISQDNWAEIISELRKQTASSFETLNTLLKWGQSQLQGAVVAQTDFRCKDIITHNLQMLHGQAVAKSLTVTDHTPELLSIHADPDHFHFIIRNLLSNAIKFTYPGGQIDIDAREDGAAVIFSVRDTGIGMSAAQQQQILSSGVGSTFGTSGEKGIGLGLLMIREYIHANGGSIWLESKEGSGTTFFFSLVRTRDEDL